MIENDGEVKCPFCGGHVAFAEFELDHGIRKETAQCVGCGARLTVSGDVMETLRALDDRLMPDGMTWPRWQDGEKVRIGDEFKASDFIATASVSSVEVGKDVFVGCMRATRLLDECTHVIPDTQERIDEDAVKTPCDYWGQAAETSCTKCPRDDGPYGCFAAKCLDLLRRQRELDARPNGKGTDE